jgi:uncharacterized protein (DUF427 family)
VKLPGPDHPIAISVNDHRVKVTLAGRVIADTTRAVTLRETSLAPVHYIPREDADMSLLTPTAHKTHCPYKGDASYFSLVVDGQTVENAVWSYEQPFPAVAEIAGRLAFYPKKVDSIVESTVK